MNGDLLYLINHKKMVQGVVGSPMAFFDLNPSGWILNRFSRDMDIMDTRIPFYLEAVGQYSLVIFVQVGHILIFTDY